MATSEIDAGTANEAGDAPETQAERPPQAHLGLALLIISAAQLMVVLDASIVNVALPSIQRDLHFSRGNLIWVVDAYTLAFGGFLLLGGRTGDLFGRRRMFMIGIGAFTLASFIGGLATTEGWLIGARVMQGTAGAIAAPTALALIASTFPEGGPRNRAMGVYAAMSGAGAAVGVLAGGVLTDYLSWRWVFFVNIPIGILVVFGTWRVLGETERLKGGLDLPGAFLATGGMTAIVYGLIHASETSWGSTWTIVSLVGGAILLIAFVLFEARTRHPLMPLSLFRVRNRSAAYGTMLAIGTAMFAMFFFLTLFIQDVLGYSPLRAGLAFLPFTIVIIVTALTVSRVVGRSGTKPPLMIGTLLASGGMFWMSKVSVDTTYWTGLLPSMVLVAAGLAMCFVPLTLTVLAGVRRDQAGIASALLNSGQQVGGSLGLAALGTIAATATRNQATSVIASLGHLAGQFSLEPIPPGTHIPEAVRVAIDSAFVHGYTTAFAVGSLILLLAFAIVTTLMRNTRPGAPAEAPAKTAPDADFRPDELGVEAL
jgi:EmrB/QacA subfamily drug resistance transporter